VVQRCGSRELALTGLYCNARVAIHLHLAASMSSQRPRQVTVRSFGSDRRRRSADESNQFVVALEIQRSGSPRVETVTPSTATVGLFGQLFGTQTQEGARELVYGEP